MSHLFLSDGGIWHADTMSHVMDTTARTECERLVTKDRQVDGEDAILAHVLSINRHTMSHLETGNHTTDETNWQQLSGIGT